MLDMQRFKQPAAEDRIHPFWFWNGDMEDDQIRHQIAEMANKGLGGFFICARQGLTVPYLSEAWFGKVRVAVEAAKWYGLHVWLYDEYPYPSGIAGGEVTLEHPEAKHYTLVPTSRRVSGGEHLSLELPWARILYAQAIPIGEDGKKRYDKAMPIREAIGNIQAEPIFQKAGLTAYNQKRFFTYRTKMKLEWIAPSGEWEVLIVQEKEIEDFKYYGTFVDPCHKEAMAAFIRLTHDQYARHLGEYFGTTIKGMFTDEIGLLGGIPWSPALAAFFREHCGYDLLANLHALIDPEAEDAARIRYDYYQSVHLLLRETYHKQVHDWCEEHGLQYVAEVPSVRHTTQLFSHVPGGDTAHEKLGRSLDWILNYQQTNFRSNAKMVSSLARQLGRERNLIECFHSVGWSMTLQDARWMIDRMAAQGTNFFNFHAFFYTVDGLTQHDAPPSQFLQNPYWPHFRKLGDYTGRISYVMSSGEAVISAAVLQPVTSMWTKMGNPFHGFSYGGKDEGEKERLEVLRIWWLRICNELTREGRDYDHLDPELLAEAEIGDGTIRLGKAEYSLLILPPMTNLESGAWAKIEAFLARGGKVVSLGQLPYETIEPGVGPDTAAAAFGVPGGVVEAGFWRRPEGRLQQYKGAGDAYYLPFAAAADAKAVLEPFTALLNALEPLPVRVLPACGEWGLLLQSRRVGRAEALVFVSNQEAEPREIKLRLEPGLWGTEDAHNRTAVAFRELSLDDGEARPLEGRAEGTGWTVRLTLAPYESRLIEAVRSAEKEQPQPVSADTAWTWEIDASAPWELEALGPNAVRFDTFRMEILGAGSELIAEGTSVPVKTFIDQCADLTASAAMPVRMKQMFGTPMILDMAYPLTVRYTAGFIVKDLPERLGLLMDRGAISGQAVIRVNGQPLEDGRFEPVFLYDHRNIAQDIAALVKEGLNELSVEVRIEHDWDGVVDALYLTGDFGVRFDDVSRPELTRVSWRKLPLQAGPYPDYPYYAGTFAFTRTMELPALPASGTFELSFNGWDPSFHDCAEVLVNGQTLGVRTWSPYRFEGDASLLRQGENRVEVRVTNTLIGLLEGKYFADDKHALLPVQERKG
ncbi:glycosyl hydrolase [Paenibacillus filicis]|uniref:Glycosyl hydrolase n=1 Tax=Paenibacillus gyeongsangnamensis TaxID=3388067 RepID=A0ABT4QCU1_9BACL|nr:glycosyl hydrolase [Paenibacillus filicis]MCZ8514698.1 glycosyl hydrolase [Paenibacillus filicis]